MTHALTETEVGLQKKCNDCGRVLPLYCFYVRDGKRLTNDGRRLRQSRCTTCFNKLRPHRGDSATQRARDRARMRALRRLAQATPELFDIFLNEELQKEGLT